MAFIKQLPYYTVMTALFIAVICVAAIIWTVPVMEGQPDYSVTSVCIRVRWSVVLTIVTLCVTNFITEEMYHG